MQIPQVTSTEKLAEMYVACRRFTHSVEIVSKSNGIEPRQYELLAAVKGWNKPQPPMVGNISQLLNIRHNTAVELIDRTAARGALARVRDRETAGVSSLC